MNMAAKISDNQQMGLNSVAVYNPSLWNDDELEKYFVARQDLLDKIINRLTKQKANIPAQHQLIIGQRGMGKSTLMQRISLFVRKNQSLNEIWLPLSFPEEQYNVKDLKDLWLNCLDALGDRLEAQGALDEADALDELIDTAKHQGEEQVLAVLINAAQKLNKRLLLLIDNIDLVFERVKSQHWHLREILQSQPELSFIGASSSVIEATYDYDAAFYDFFKVLPLKPLTRSETHTVLDNLARVHQVPVVNDILNHDPARIDTLHTLTGGNPRTVVLLFKVLAQGINGDVRSDLEGLLDIVTPLYKARFEELSVASQQLVDAVALHWDPISANILAEKLSISVNQVSSQLNRLVQSGVIEKVPAATGKRLNFQVSERFFNIWYLMRASRRVRKKLIWLVYFLKMFFTSKELEQQAKARLQDENCEQIREAEYNLALAQTVKGETRRALEHSALYGLYRYQNHSLVDGMFDLKGEDSELKTAAERVKRLEQMRVKLIAVFKQRADLDELLAAYGHEFSSKLIDVETLVEGLLSAPLGLTRKQFYFASIESASTSTIIDVLRTIKANRVFFQYLDQHLASCLFKALRQGIMERPYDLEGAKVAEKRFGTSQLVHLVVFSRLFFEDVTQADKQVIKTVVEQANRDFPTHQLTYFLQAYYYYRFAYEKLDEYLSQLEPSRDISPYVLFLEFLVAERNGYVERQHQAALLLTNCFSDFYVGWYGLAHVQNLLLNQPKQAIKSYQQVDFNYLRQLNIANIYCYQLSDFEQALAYYQQASQKFEASCVVYFGLADALNELGDYSARQQALTTATELGVNQLSEIFEYSQYLFDVGCYQYSCDYLIRLVNLCNDHNSEQIQPLWHRVLWLIEDLLLQHIDINELSEKVNQASDAIFWRALQYALRALAEDDMKVLNALAPELKGPANEIVAQLKGASFNP